MGDKLLFWTDIHFDNFSAFSTITNDGYNSRFWKQVEVVESLLKYAERTGCKMVFGGDFYNRRMLVPTDVLHVTFEMISAYPSVTHYWIIGNHDMYTWNCEKTTLQVFRNLPNVNLITSVTDVYVHPSTSLCLVPHGAPLPTRSAEDRNYSILCTHYGVNEARLGPKDTRMKDDLTIKQLKDMNYDLVMIGHIHKPQALSDNIIVMGSPMAHSFHEANEEKYFYVFDAVTKELVKYPTGAPQFRYHDVYTTDDLVSISIDDGNYHRINVLSKSITLSDLQDYTGPNVVISRIAEDVKGHTADMEAIQARSPQQEVDDYYNSLETELDKDKLVEESMKIIGDA